MTSPAPIRAKLRDIEALAARHPHAAALCHKRRGAWEIWSWADLAARVGQLGDRLRERHPRAALIAVSGDYAPSLLAFVLAAARIGAAVVPLPTNLTQSELAEWLAGARPDLVFVGLRQQVGVWRAALRQAGQTPELVADFHLPWGRANETGITPAAELLGPAPAALAPPSGGELLWIEDGTDWPEGLPYILHAAAEAGTTLAFPENRAAAGRDRREIQPTAFALSPAHRERLHHDIAARLPTGHGVAAHLSRAALQAAGAGRARWHHRLLLRRVRRPLGLARLRELTVVGTAAGPSSESGADLFAALGIRSGHLAQPAQHAPADRTSLAFA